MKSVRFRCPKCRAHHSAVPARAGQLIVCSTCFGPILIPEGLEATAAEVPAVAPTLVAPTPRVEVPVEEAPVEEAPAFDEPVPAGRWGRREAVGVLSIVAGLGVVGAVGLMGSKAGREPAAVAPVPVAVAARVEAAPVIPAPEPEPIPVVAAEPVPVVVPEPAPAGPTRAVPPAPPDPNRPLVIRRRQTLGADALRRQLAALPELSAEEGTEAALISLHKVPPPRMTHSPAAALTAADRAQLRRAALQAKDRRRPAANAVAPEEEPAPKPAMRVASGETAPTGMIAMLAQKQPELAVLPWRMGEECHLERENAEDLQVLSRALRNILVKATPQGDTRPDADRLRLALLAEPEAEAPKPAETPNPQAATARPRFRPKFAVPAAIPALMQLLMAERTPVRLVLVDVLAKVECKDAARSLARLAVFDLAPEVREQAMRALRGRAAEDYRSTLVEGLRFPWAPAADHAAEALVALGDTGAIPELVGLLDQPDPQAPKAEVRDGRTVTVARSLVQVNHLQNCVMCHAPSANPTTDLVRGRVPDEYQPLPPPVEYYAESSPGLFVKAEVTYLRQDFSVTQPVANAGPWPSYQRYDYLVSDRPVADRLSDRRARSGDGYPQRDSVLFALRELTGKDLGTEAGAWKGVEVPTTPSE